MGLGRNKEMAVVVQAGRKGNFLAWQVRPGKTSVGWGTVLVFCLGAGKRKLVVLPA